MNNPYSNDWNDVHASDTREERALAALEARDAEDDSTVCGKCGDMAWYRPGVGAYQCVSCRAVLSYKGDWR